MTKSTDTPLGHTVTHTDTAQGKGGGRLTQKPETATSETGGSETGGSDTGTPGAETAGQGDAENGKSDDARSVSGGQHGQDPQKAADRSGKTGKDLGIT